MGVVWLASDSHQLCWTVWGSHAVESLLIIVDAHSKFIDAQIVSSATTSVTLTKLRLTFSFTGLPHTIVSDNGSCFTVEEFEQFCHTREMLPAMELQNVPSRPWNLACAKPKGIWMTGCTLCWRGTEWHLGVRQELRASAAFETPPQTHFDLLRPSVQDIVIQKQAYDKNINISLNASMFVTLSTEWVSREFGLNVRRRLDCVRHVRCTYDIHSQSARTCVIGLKNCGARTTSIPSQRAHASSVWKTPSFSFRQVDMCGNLIGCPRSYLASWRDRYGWCRAATHGRSASAAATASVNFIIHRHWNRYQTSDISDLAATTSDSAHARVLELPAATRMTPCETVVPSPVRRSIPELPIKAPVKLNLWTG